MDDIREYTKNENFKYLVIEASHGDYYGFNLKVKKERAIAMKIVSPDEHDDFMIVGWKVSKTLPKWVRNANSWIDFNNGKVEDESEVVEAYEVGKVGGKDDEDEEEHEEEEEEEKEEEDDEEEEEYKNENIEEEEEEFNNVLEEHDNEYGEEDVVDTEEEGEDKDETTDVDEEEDKKDEEEEEDEEEDDEKEEEGDSKRFGCYGKSKNITVKSKNSDNDEFIFASISGSDLKKEVARNVLTSMKTDTVDIFISGPFRNVKSGKSSWIVVFGDYGSAWTLKSQFIKGYIGTLLTKVNRPNIDTGHSSSYYDINIRKYEYGEESVWKRKEQNKTTKRLSLVYTCDSNNEKNGKLGLIEAVEFLFWSMKKREINPIGCLVVEFLKEHASALYSYLLKKKTNEDLVAEDITVDIDKHFRAGFVVHWDDCLNHWMVDYDIIRVLKGYVGYSSWAEVPTKQRAHCYKNYNKKVTLPEWDIDQERY